MKIIEPYARMLGVPGADGASGNVKLAPFTLEDGIRLLQHIEWCARISHRSEDAVTEDSWKRIIKNVVLDHGDWSVVEHASVTVDAYVDRGITHEWVRHRLFSYTQESTRFVNYQKKMPPSFVQPPFDLVNATGRAQQICWHNGIQNAEQTYQSMIAAGAAPQIARSVFPNSLASRLIVTGNLRNWRHFFIMRTTQEAHPQMKQVTIPLLLEFKEKIPLLFDDLEPNMKQSIAMSRPR